MSEIREVLKRMSHPQKVELVRLARIYPGSTWHVNDCGCCVCLHPDDNHSGGYIIGQDGSSEYVRQSH